MAIVPPFGPCREALLAHVYFQNHHESESGLRMRHLLA